MKLPANLEDFPKGLRQAIIDRREMYGFEHDDDNSIFNTFYWCDTDEGDAYWDSLDCGEDYDGRFETPILRQL